MDRLAEKMDCDVKVIDFRYYDLPSFNDRFLNRKKLSKFQEKMIKAWSKADLVIVISPEYNWFPTAEIINTVNHLGSESNKDLWDNKVFAFAGVSTGRGGRMPAVQLTTVFNKIISYTHSNSICSPKIYESHFTTRSIDEDGRIKEDDDVEKAIKRFVQFNVDMAQRWTN